MHIYSHLSLDKDNPYSSCLRHNCSALPYAAKGQAQISTELSHIVSTSWEPHDEHA